MSKSNQDEGTFNNDIPGMSSYQDSANTYWKLFYDGLCMESADVLKIIENSGQEWYL